MYIICMRSLRGGWHLTGLAFYLVLSVHGPGMEVALFSRLCPGNAYRPLMKILWRGMGPRRFDVCRQNVFVTLRDVEAAFTCIYPFVTCVDSVYCVHRGDD